MHYQGTYVEGLGHTIQVRPIVYMVSDHESRLCEAQSACVACYGRGSGACPQELLK